jgi:hypothetical protein
MPMTDDVLAVENTFEKRVVWTLHREYEIFK